jgi:hypothetical protein
MTTAYPLLAGRGVRGGLKMSEPLMLLNTLTSLTLLVQQSAGFAEML